MEEDKVFDVQKGDSDKLSSYSDSTTGKGGPSNTTNRERLYSVQSDISGMVQGIPQISSENSVPTRKPSNE